MKIFNKRIAGLKLKEVLLGLVLFAGLSSCTSDPNSPGVEYMPDMYRPQPYEAYLEKHDIDSAKFFDRNIEKLAPSFEDLTPEDQALVVKEVELIYALWNKGSSSRKPVEGTVARGKKPYLLAKNERAASKGIKNPFAFDKQNVKEGKAYYEIFCDHCHGEKGDGNGPMIQLGVYPAQPPSFKGAAKDLSAGEIYHTIYHGKGVMGSHASQISPDKRWKIVCYVQSLQGKEVGEASAVESADSLVNSSEVITEVAPVDSLK